MRAAVDQNGLIVVARDIVRNYQTGGTVVEALRGVSLSVRSGEFVGIMGASGSGKSTLLHLLGCLETPTSGSYHLGGRDISLLNDKELSLIRATKIGFIFQTFNLVSQCTVMENVTMPFLYRPGDSAGVREKAEKAIEQVGLTDRQTHKPSELSGGEKQRVAIARALAVDPLMILADEPTGNLDTKTSGSILSLFSELNEQQVTIIMVTHDEQVASSCHRVVRLSDGLIVAEETQ